MREFFKGWRRKAGVVTLVMACVVVISWVRSCVWDESAFVRFERLAIFFHHENGRFIVWRDVMANEGVPFGWETGGRIDDSHASTKTPPKWILNSHTAAGQHWVLATPLTLLSACLILWKPRKRGQEKVRGTNGAAAFTGFAEGTANEKDCKNLSAIHPVI